MPTMYVCSAFRTGCIDQHPLKRLRMSCTAHQHLLRTGFESVHVGLRAMQVRKVLELFTEIRFQES